MAVCSRSSFHMCLDFSLLSGILDKCLLLQISQNLKSTKGLSETDGNYMGTNQMYVNVYTLICVCVCLLVI